MQSDFEAEVRITEKWRYKKVLLGVLLVPVLALAGYGAYQYGRTLIPQEVSVDGEVDNVENFGLQDSSAVVPLVGKLYYSVWSKETAETNSVPFVYQYDAAEKVSDLKTHFNVTSFTNLSTSTALVLALSDTVNDWQPYQFDLLSEKLTALPNVQGLNVRDLALSSNGLRYAYSYQKPDDSVDTTGGISTDLATWNIAIHTMGFDEVTTIEAAAEPHWSTRADELLYMKTDGLYRYNVATKKSTLVTNRYTPFTLRSDFAVSEKTKKIIVTSDVPLLQVAAIFELPEDENDTAREIARMTSEVVHYTQPVFSVDGNSYAMAVTTFVAATNTDESFIDPEIEKKVIEIRGQNNYQPTATIEMPVDTTGELLLLSWSAE